MWWHRRIKRVEWILDSVRLGLRGKARYISPDINDMAMPYSLSESVPLPPSIFLRFVGKSRYKSQISMIWLYPIRSPNLYHSLLPSSRIMLPPVPLPVVVDKADRAGAQSVSRA